MPCSTPISEPSVTIPIRSRNRQSRLNRKSSVREVQAECQQIRSEWSCEEGQRRQRLADVMQVRLLDVLTT